MSVRDTRLHDNGASQQLNGSLRVPGRLLDHAEETQRVEVIRFQFQHGTVKHFCIGKLALPMQRHGFS